MVPALLATAMALATGVPLVISVYRDNMAKLEAKTSKTEAKTDKVEAEAGAVYVKITKPQLEGLEKRVAQLEAEKVAEKALKRAGQRRRPIPVVPVKKVAPLPATPTAVLQAPAPVPVAPPAPKIPDAGQ
jgi:hypothetical protein